MSPINLEAVEGEIFERNYTSASAKRVTNEVCRFMFSLPPGGGFEHSLFGPLTLRARADYQRTRFVNSTGALQHQNNLRLATSVAYRFRIR